MGGAASKDFLENGQRGTVAQELDELGGYDRPALAKNQSFTARLDWLGTQVGKTSDQMQAALSKDEQAGRRELEKEAKRRQLMALRRGQGDIQSNLQYAEFYLKQKQYERGPITTSASILRNSPLAALAAADAVEAAEPSSPKAEAARRTSEQIATLQRLYSSKNGPGPAPAGHKPGSPEGMPGAPGGAEKGGSHVALSHSPAPPAAGGNSKWRQTVAQAKKTAFLAVGTYVAINAKRKVFAPSRIEDVGLFAEQQLGDGVHKFIEEGDKLAAARDKLPEMKAELELLRTEIRQLAVEQQAVEATAALDGDNDEADDSAQLEAAGIIVQEASDEAAVDAAEAAATAAAAAAAMRHPRQKATTPNNKPRWHIAGGADLGFGTSSGTMSYTPKGKAATPRLRDAPTSAPPGHPSPAATAVSAPLPLATHSQLPSVSSPLSPPAAFTPARRRVNTATGQSPSAGPAPPSPGPSPSPGIGLGVLGPGLGSQRTSIVRASWSGGVSQPDAAAAAAAAGGAGGPVVQDILALPLGVHGGPLRPSRPSAPGVARVGVAPPPGMRCRSENASAAGAAASAAAPTGRPPSSPGRTLLGPRPPSGSGSPGAGSNGLRPGPLRIDNPARVSFEAPSTPGEHRVGTMALRIASRVALPVRAAARHQLRALRDAETANVLRQQQLIQAIEENAAVLQTSSGLLNMYCNRANGRWVEMQQWAMPQVHDVTMPAVRRQVERYKDLVLKDLKEGRVAVQIHVDDDVFLSARLGAVPLWSVDPWQMLAVTHPARTEWTPHLVGLGMGVRQLLALATAVEALGGPEAVGRMQVVVCCHEGQVDAVVRDLSARKLCRFSPDNVIISVQQRAHGHTYDKAKHGFVPVPEAPLRASGSGYALLSLCWAGPDSFRLGGPELTERRPLERSALDTYMERDVKWLASWRLRDLIQFSPDSCLNLEQLALSYALADSVDANMSMQVELVDTLYGINRYGAGIVLALKERAAMAPAPPPTAATTPLLRRNKQQAASAVAAATAAADGTTTAPKPPSPPDSQSPHPPSSQDGSPAGQTRLHQSHPQVPLQVPSQPQPHTSSAPASPSPHGGGGAARPASPRVALENGVSNGVGNGNGGGGGGGHGIHSNGGSMRSIKSQGSGSGLRAGGIGTDGGPLAVCDIKWADVQTPALAAGLQQLVDTTAAQTGSTPRIAVSIKRYMYHVPTLKGILTGPAAFRPSVSVGEGGYLYVTFDASDLTVLPAARCVALTYTPRASVNADGLPNGLGGSPNSASSLSNGGGGYVPNGSYRSPVQGPAGGGGGGAAPLPRIASAGPGGPAAGGGGSAAAGGTTNGAIAAATAAAAAAAMQRGRLLTNDSDLDTLLWVVADQDNHPAFRATVSATNTARSRVTSHAAGGLAAAVVGGVPGRALHPQQSAIVVAVTDDVACPLAVRMAMAIMKPGADCLHLLSIAKDPSSMAVAAARAVAERFETIASATLGDVKSVVQVKRLSIVEDIASYAESVRAVLLVTGSINLTAAPGSSVVGSVALSLARDSTRPMLVVKPNCRLAETAYEVGKKPCLRAAVCAETSARPMVRFVVDHVLDGSRGDKLVLVRGRAFDKDMQELTSSRRILDHLAEEATSNRRFESSAVVRRMVPGSFEAENQRVADADQCHIVAVQVPECRGPLPANVAQLLRTSRAAVLLYRTTWRLGPPTGADSSSELGA